MKLLKATRENIQLAAETIKKGGLVIYPTDTVYGLGCNPFNINAVKRVFEVKGRTGKPLPVLAYNIKNAQKIAFFNDKAIKIAKNFWPGPVTIVLQKKHELPEIVTCGFNSIGVRVPNHEMALELIRLSGGFLVGTSANKSGEVPPKRVEEAAAQIGEKVDLILDGGETPLGSPSTVVDLTMDKLAVVREGPVKLNIILKVLEA